MPTPRQPGRWAAAAVLQKQFSSHVVDSCKAGAVPGLNSQQAPPSWVGALLHHAVPCRGRGQPHTVKAAAEVNVGTGRGGGLGLLGVVWCCHRLLPLCQMRQPAYLTVCSEGAASAAASIASGSSLPSFPETSSCSSAVSCNARGQVRVARVCAAGCRSQLQLSSASWWASQHKQLTPQCISSSLLTCGSSCTSDSQSSCKSAAASSCRQVRAGPAASASTTAAVSCRLPLSSTVRNCRAERSSRRWCGAAGHVATAA